MEDLSYLTTEYARNKDLECYDIEAKEREKKEKEKEECQTQSKKQPMKDTLS